MWRTYNTKIQQWDKSQVPKTSYIGPIQARSVWDTAKHQKFRIQTEWHALQQQHLLQDKI